MRRRSVFAPTVSLAALIAATPLWATNVQSPDDATLMLSVGAVGVSVTNILCMTVGNGSRPVGIAGAAIGTGLITWSLITDSLEDEDRTPYIGLGIAAIAFGACDFWRAGKGRDTQLFGLHVEPSIRSFDQRRWLGVQLSAPW